MKKPEHYKSLVRVQFAITYIDSRIIDPLGRMDPMIYSFEADGSVVVVPKTFFLRMKLEAVEVRGEKSRSKKPLKILPLLITHDITNGGQLFHKPYTKADIKRIREEDAKRQAEFEKELDDYDD